jgi:hypothetical protein
MSHFAKVENGVVTKVIVAEQDFINTGLVGDPKSWIQTSYNTHGGQHPEGKPLRANYAGIGYTYNASKDVFIPPKPEGFWILDNETYTWIETSEDEFISYDEESEDEEFNDQE